MAIEKTLSILKPDAVKCDVTDEINSYIKNSGLKIVAQKIMLLTREQAELFYEIHKDRPFFGELVEFMISGPVVVQVLVGENAVSRYRAIMGATDPKQAAKGTIRGDFAEDISENRVHGSDSVESAHREIACFFTESELRDIDIPM
ncbi:nucleoside-diphosphate kinase [Wolbachia endosymbiont of Pentalonia nigronervosa]|jgi:nucleoside-diphosphate kinase|uniref:nucleoside-diphosphate kinase n=1 Tax=Wolbachia endosymbiont of Pentalonia nigronervosa TaxID=1301914 RepID=UPI00165F2B62|nr:nucleoside-diphosphate kinase [Wolbachia endosymbiont of Pentalonia nigronervosa]MBD0391536.1 nucleoside-diphosphate kinase [Wolbachia endosymbiont of Pentalonia nigronervosa]